MSNQVDNYSGPYNPINVSNMQIAYTVRFPEPHTHYISVEIKISNCNTPDLLLKMPVWTPGSYLIREFARHIDFVEVKHGDHVERVSKVNKNTWKISAVDQPELLIRYNLYCFEKSVRTNTVDDTYAFLSGAATFLYVAGQENTPVQIHIEPHKGWDKISTPLTAVKGNPWHRTAKNTDELFDSPIEIGNHVSHFFEAGGIPHEVAIYGGENKDSEKLLNDLKAVIEEEVKVFGSHPCKNYLFIIHHSENSDGGLEHMDSSVNHISRFSYDGKKYQRAISLLAHEYFHLWNVKRIRPVEFSTYNYDEETYTRLLWFFEGVTSYYDDLFCYRAGVFTKDAYLQIVADNLNRVLNTPGIHVQSLAEASFDAWLKYYRQNENSVNSQVSYYTKGAVVAMLFDFLIMDATEGDKSFDDVLYTLYQKYLSDPSKGVSENNILQIMNTLSGIDFTSYFQKCIHSTAAIEPGKYFELAGLRLFNEDKSDQYHTGMSTQWKAGKLYITKLERGFGAYASGLNVHDEIISIDGVEVMEEFEKIFANKNPGDTLQLIISRQGMMREISMTLTPDTRFHYKIEDAENISEKQEKIRDRWLRCNSSLTMDN